MSAREKFESLASRLPGAETVAPSKIGGQFYCEKKVDLEQELGDVETPEKQRGTETHEKAAEDAVEADRDEMWDAIERGERQIILESMFLGEAADFVVIGIPDAIVFDDGKPQLVFDRKTTSRPGTLYDNQQIQIWVYGFMLASLGFDTNDLQLAILSHDRSLDSEVGKLFQNQILGDDWVEGKYTLEEEPEAVLYVSDYSPIEYLEELSWALEYWREEREPEVATSRGKCRACPYNDECADSLV